MKSVMPGSKQEEDSMDFSGRRSCAACMKSPSPIHGFQAFTREGEESLSSPIISPIPLQNQFFPDRLESTTPRKSFSAKAHRSARAATSASLFDSLKKGSSEQCAVRSPLLDITSRRKYENKADKRKTLCCPREMKAQEAFIQQCSDKENSSTRIVQSKSDLHCHWGNTGEHLERMRSLYLLSNKTSCRYSEIVDVGIDLAMGENNTVVVVKLRPGFAALESALVRQGDILRAVDFADIAGMPAQHISALLQGKRGTTVNLTVMRHGKEHLVQLLRISTRSHPPAPAAAGPPPAPSATTPSPPRNPDSDALAAATAEGQRQAVALVKSLQLAYFYEKWSARKAVHLLAAWSLLARRRRRRDVILRRALARRARRLAARALQALEARGAGRAQRPPTRDRLSVAAHVDRIESAQGRREASTQSAVALGPDMLSPSVTLCTMLARGWPIPAITAPCLPGPKAVRSLGRGVAARVGGAARGQGRAATAEVVLGRARGILDAHFGAWCARGFQARCFRATRVAAFGLPRTPGGGGGGASDPDWRAWLRRQSLRRRSGAARAAAGCGGGGAAPPCVAASVTAAGGPGSLSSAESCSDDDGGEAAAGERCASVAVGPRLWSAGAEHSAPAAADSPGTPHTAMDSPSLLPLSLLGAVVAGTAGPPEFVGAADSPPAGFRGPDASEPPVGSPGP